MQSWHRTEPSRRSESAIGPQQEAHMKFSVMPEALHRPVLRAIRLARVLRYG
jgi:hypothetical protein